ncbi:MAG: OmpH family outer membrane protein [Bacteroidales bacterium]|jgi:Skp family chaperone for outer membrane proteins|nr:OmpH family outer membrane protein [Bacteroidales bacterium]MCI1785377.1 OmpH family outer membrane protein [Bacteroidales bacterium]
MKNTPLILSIIALAAVVVLGIFSIFGSSGSKKASKADNNAAEATIEKGAYVYFNLDRVLNEYDMANDLRSVVETKVQGISDEVTRRGNKLQSDVNIFQEKINKGLLTSSVAEIQGQKLKKQQNDFNLYANQQQQKINEEQQVMMNQIGDAIKTFLDKYNEEKHYAMIIATQGDVMPSPVVAGDTSLDITDDLLARLNEDYVKNKGKKDITSVSSDKNSNKTK